jgi:peptide/nickel transport system substrate-binding protein
MKIGNILPKTKRPSKNQWAQIFSILDKREKILLLSFSVLFLTSVISLFSVFYCKHTEIGPAVGGSYREGMVGSPRFINPVYAAANDADSLLAELIFSGLMEYDSEGKLVPELASQVEIEESGTGYLVSIREDAVWHDGEPLTADDVIFTIKTIQNPDYKSPLRANYLGIEVEKITDYQVRFKLQESYAGFLERLTFKILPKHIWEEISSQNFLLSNYNLRPIGSGPYQFKDLKQNPSGAISEIDLVRFKKYCSDKKIKEPYISELSVLFFETEEDLARAARSKNIDGFTLPSQEYWELARKNSYQEISLSLPRYFALFLNEGKSNLLKEEDMRKALNYATDKKEIISEVLLNRAKEVNSPILPEIYGFTPPSDYYDYDVEKAEALLTSAGFEKEEGQWVKAGQASTAEFTSKLQEGSQSSQVTALQTCLAKDPEIYPSGKITGYFGPQTKTAVVAFQEKYAQDILKPAGLTKGTGVVSANTRKKLNEICGEPTQDTVLTLHLSTVEDPTLIAVAEKIKKQWGEIGIGLEIEVFSSSELQQDIIKNRNYEILLFGEVLTAVIDPFPFWHSSQTKDPGLNLSAYENSAVDKLLEKARIATDEEERAEKYELLQSIIIEQAPAVFLYTPDYIYMTSKDIIGPEEKTIFDPAQRFSNIEEWYIKTKRTWKSD